MPHAVFNLGSQTGPGDLAARRLVPGVEPGGQRAGRETKPALLIQDVYLQINDLVDAGTTGDFQGVNVFLKLSQELDLTPGLILFIGSILASKTNAAGNHYTLAPQDMGSKIVGTVWAPRVVGVRFEEIGNTIDSWDIDVHLEYERIEVPWMDWFLMWDFLDGIADNETEY